MKVNISKIRRMRLVAEEKRKSSLRSRATLKKTLALATVFGVAILLLSADTNAMYIDKDGNVGIGTREPTATLDVNGSVNIANDLKIGGKISGRIQDETGVVMPVGAILPYYGTKAPAGWLICDGKTDLSSDKKYAELRALCGDRVPNLQGVFLRGLDVDRGFDLGRGLGSYQGDAIQNHQHDYEDRYVSDSRDGDCNGNCSFDRHPDSHSRTTGYAVGATTASETRPKNVAVNFIIKY